MHFTLYTANNNVIFLSFKTPIFSASWRLFPVETPHISYYFPVLIIPETSCLVS